jgi:hypothetical protein
MQIDHECPQCGGPVTLEETDRLLQCSFCNTKLYIYSKDHIRYYLPAPRSREEETIYIPYWRFRGMHFSCRKDGIQDGIIDKTVLALQDRSFPATLGIRPQAMKLRFVHKMENTRFIEPQFSFDESSVKIDESATYRFDMMRDETPQGISRSIFGDNFFMETPAPEPALKDNKLFHEAFIAETLSAVYTPVFIRDNRVYDGITEEIIVGMVDDGSLTKETSTGDWAPQFLPTLCPNCGWDLVADRNSCILLCNRCNAAWQASVGSLQQVAYGVIPIDGKSQKTTCLPFWRISLEIEGIKLQSYADIVRLANLPKIIQPEWEGSRLYFWVPAFKIAPAVFLRLARQITLANPAGELRDDFSGADLWAVNVALSEALESLKVVLAQIAINKSEIVPRLKDVKLSPEESLLVFYPFIDSGYELTQPAISCAVPKNTLHWGKNI